MPITDIPILSMLRTRLDWTQSRQKVLAENVANADTPGFQARDLSPLKFEPAGETPAAGGVGPVTLATTEKGHLPGLAGSAAPFHSRSDGHYEVRPTGNAVNLEEEMMKVAANQMDFQTASALYTHSLGLIKIALGKK
jgi:flagellar basal-body rod protein FlgB